LSIETTDGSQFVEVVLASFFGPSVRFDIVVAKHSYLGWKCSPL